jgi:PAS domain-containing protein
MLGGAWEASLRSEIERNLDPKDSASRSPRGNRPHAILSPTSPLRKDKPPALASPSSIPGKSSGRFGSEPGGHGKSLGHAPEFVAALSGQNRRDERRSATIGVPFLYVAAPVSGGAVRLAYPLSDVEAVSALVAPQAGAGFRLGLSLSLFLSPASQPSGPLAAWNASSMSPPASPKAICRPASAKLRRTKSAAWPAPSTKRPAASKKVLPPSVSSQRQLETLLNSMQDAVIAVSADGLVQWANQPMDRLVPQGTRLQQPVVETIRDPDFLATVKEATHA